MQVIQEQPDDLIGTNLNYYSGKFKTIERKSHCSKY